MMKQTEWMQMKNVWSRNSRCCRASGSGRREATSFAGARPTARRASRSTSSGCFPDANEQTALKWLRDEQTRLRAGVDDSPEKPRQRFAVFAASLFEHKVKVRDIKSAAGRNKWSFTLEHLIAGTTGSKSGKYVTGFGDFFVDKIESRRHRTLEGATGRAGRGRGLRAHDDEHLDRRAAGHHEGGQARPRSAYGRDRRRPVPGHQRARHLHRRGAERAPSRRGARLHGEAARALPAALRDGVPRPDHRAPPVHASPSSP